MNSGGQDRLGSKVLAIGNKVLRTDESLALGSLIFCDCELVLQGVPTGCYAS